MLNSLRCCLLAGLASVPTVAAAQDHEFPLLNTIGRKLGLGYSHTGYHARIDGRRQAVPPANAYGSHALQYPYSPDYQPQRPMRPMPMYAPSQMPMAGAVEQPSAAPALPPASDEPKKPLPLPEDKQYLKKYLIDEEPADEDVELLPRPKRELSPAKPLAPPNPKGDAPFFMPSDQSPTPATSPSDRPAADDDLLLDDDDDLLLLDDEDLSARRRQNMPPTVQRRVSSTPRRYYGQPISIR